MSPVLKKPVTTSGSAAGHSQSHGRGGAGNINSKPSGPVDIGAISSTPTIKSATYTTGRGGTGNMVANDPANPYITRAAQDIEVPAYHSRELKGTYHWGRGGEGNAATVGEEHKSEEHKSDNAKERRGSFQGAVEKGKEVLGLKRKEGHAPAEKYSSVVVED